MVEDRRRLPPRARPRTDFIDDAGLARRLMRMKNASVALFLLVGACGSDRDLQLDLDRRTEPGGPDPIGELSWVTTDLGSAQWNGVETLDWGDDGSLLASAVEDDRPPGAPPEWRTRLIRFAPDGEKLWSVLLDVNELDIGVPLPDGSDEDIQIHFSSATIGAIDQADDGTVVVAVNAAVSYTDYGSPAITVLTTTRSLIHWYDADGKLLATANLGGMTDFPKNDSVDDVVNVNSVRAVPDGSVVWSGMVSRGVNLDGLDLISEGAIGRAAQDGDRPWTVVLGKEQDFPDTIAPEEETARDLHLLPDGGVAVRGDFRGKLVIGDKTAHADDRGAYVARVDLDGNVTWLETFDAANTLGWWDSASGMGVADSGNLFAMIQFDDEETRVAEIDPNGDLVELRDVEWPPPQYPQGVDRDFEIMTVSGDSMVTAGSIAALGDEDVIPAFVAIHDVTGGLVDVRGFGPSKAGSEITSFMMDVGPQGQLAVGGTFKGEVDFGDGPIDTEPGIENQAFLVVYGPDGEGTDVD
jgi:hypothetical protein